MQRRTVWLVGVALALAVIVVGGYTFVRQEADRLRRETAIETAREQLETESSREVAVVSEGETTPEVLPETGPADTSAAMIGLGVVTYVAVYLVQGSRSGGRNWTPARI